MNKQKRDKKQIMVKIMALFLAGLMIIATAGTFIYYILIAA